MAEWYDLFLRVQPSGAGAISTNLWGSPKQHTLSKFRGIC